MKQKTQLVIALLLVITSSLNAQERDSLAALRAFVNTLGTAVQAPVNMQITIINNSDVLFSAEDSFSIEAVVHLQGNRSYMRFGEVEQLVNDSMMLMISDSLEQFILLPGSKRPSDNQWMGMPGLSKGDSSIRKLNMQYRATFIQDKIQLQSRGLLAGTSLPKELVQLEIEKQTLQPVQLVMIRRTLVPVDSLQAEEIRQLLPAATVSRLIQQNLRKYFVKETETRFIYRHIDHNEQELPVTIADRVEKDTEGQWKPVRAYEAYRFINQTNE